MEQIVRRAYEFTNLGTKVCSSFSVKKVRKSRSCITKSFVCFSPVLRVIAETARNWYSANGEIV
jgi:hypothetical protein